MCNDGLCIFDYFGEFCFLSWTYSGHEILDQIAVTMNLDMVSFSLLPMFDYKFNGSFHYKSFWLDDSKFLFVPTKAGPFHTSSIVCDKMYHPRVLRVSSIKIGSYRVARIRPPFLAGDNLF